MRIEVDLIRMKVPNKALMTGSNYVIASCTYDITS